MYMPDISIQQPQVGSSSQPAQPQNVDKSASGAFQTLMAQAKKGSQTEGSTAEGPRADDAAVADQTEDELLPQNVTALPTMALFPLNLVNVEVPEGSEGGAVAPLALPVQTGEAGIPAAQGDAPQVRSEGFLAVGGQVQPHGPEQVTQESGESTAQEESGDTAARQESAVEHRTTAATESQARQADQLQVDGRSKAEEQPLPDGESALSQQPVFHRVESAPVKVGESYQVDTQAPDLEQSLAQAIRQGVDTGAQQVEIRLAPEHLGAMTIRLSQNGDGTLQVMLHTENSRAAGVLSQHLDGLQQALAGLGHGPVQVEVQRGQESQQPEQQPYQQTNPDGRGQQQQGQRQQPRQEHVAAGEDFLHRLRLGLTLDEAI